TSSSPPSAPAAPAADPPVRALGASPCAFFLAARLPTFRTAQPTTAFRLLTMPMTLPLLGRTEAIGSSEGHPPEPAGGMTPGDRDEGTSCGDRCHERLDLAVRLRRVQCALNVVSTGADDAGGDDDRRRLGREADADRSPAAEQSRERLGQRHGAERAERRAVGALAPRQARTVGAFPQVGAQRSLLCARQCLVEISRER